jgi:drug/metabolite transporter (DMT)-like permease
MDTHAYDHDQDAPVAPRVSTRPDSLTQLLFVISVFVGGSNFIAVRFAVAELPPLWGAASRFAVAAVLFWIIAISQRIPLPRGRALLGVILFGTFSIALFFGLTYLALSRIPAGLGSILAALGPLMTFLLAVAHHTETFRWRALAGAIIAVAGIAVAFFQLSDGILLWLPVLAMLAAVVSQAEGSLTLKRFPPVSPVLTNALGLTVGAVILVIASRAAGEVWRLPTQPGTWIAVLYLIFFGTLVLFYLYVLMLKRWTASGTAYMFVLMPFVTVALGAWLANETVTAGLIVGAVLVLLGVWVGALSRHR